IRSHPIGNGAENFIANTMTIGIVDGLEMIQIHQQERKLLTESILARKEGSKGVVECTAVKQLGQTIVVSAVGESILGLVRPDYRTVQFFEHAMEIRRNTHTYLLL